MSPRPVYGLGLALVAAVPLAAQQEIPDDWTWRPDAPASAVTGQDLGPNEVRFVTMAPGWHVTTGTTGMVLHPKGHTVEGRYGVQVEVFWFPNRENGQWADPSDAPWGIILDHPDAAPDNPSRMEFLIRRDGKVRVQVTRDGQVTALSEWTADATVKAHDGKSITKYVLRMEYAAERVSFAVNGKELLGVHVGEAPHAVIPGLRVGAGLNMHVSRFDLLTPLAPVRPPRAEGS